MERIRYTPSSFCAQKASPAFFSYLFFMYRRGWRPILRSLNSRAYINRATNCLYMRHLHVVASVYSSSLTYSIRVYLVSLSCAVYVVRGHVCVALHRVSEPHSKRLKVKVTLRKEVLNKVMLQQEATVEVSHQHSCFFFVCFLMFFVLF